MHTDILWYRLVEETMQPLDSDRRAFRMVGGVLVERTVGEVLPVVIDNRKKVSTFEVLVKKISIE